MYMHPERQSLKTMFAFRFLGALARINQRRSSSSAATTIIKRSRRIKLAADASMASTVGTKRDWSRAVLRKLRNRSRPRTIPIRTKVSMAKRKRAFGGPQPELSQADKLRYLLPGGKAMDFCSLLDETASYIKCLTTQVQVMQKIADSLGL
ncbi:transcription factor IBH1 [Magnolia sinica]|uniref:transcription factor IBH1 n=1 Tax=Magnolia sinica TaxID=86752 RepID=UPI00265AF4F4|nr:transcription factor IBH1 [Magnolia sinica]